MTSIAMPDFKSEDDIEQATLQKLQHLQAFNLLKCFTEHPNDLNDGSVVEAEVEFFDEVEIAS